MSERIKAFFKFTIFIFAAAVIVSVCGLKMVSAEGEEPENWVHYHGNVTKNGVNVRKGAGTNFDVLQDKDGNDIKLVSQTELIILEESVAEDGKVWYKATFKKGEDSYEGFIRSDLASKQTDDPITPTPIPATPTPEPEVTDDKSASDTEKPIVTQAPKPTINGDTDKDSSEEEGGNSKSTILFVIFAIIAIFAAVFIFIIVNSILKQNKKKKKSHTSRKVDRLRREQEDGGNGAPSGKRRPEIKRAANEGASVREIRQDVYYTNTESDDDLLGLINQENDDKKSLRAAVDRLQEHDIIIHKVYGEGEVYDNSDVKLMEVRFGNDVRFLNKDSIVSKKLVEVFDDEDQALARRRNKRKTNKR